MISLGTAEREKMLVSFDRNESLLTGKVCICKHEFNDEEGQRQFYMKKNTFLGHQRSYCRGQRCYTFMTWIIVLALAAFGIFTLCQLTYTQFYLTATKVDVYRPNTFPDASINLCYCGVNTTEAQSLNCAYDTLAAAWLPEHCRDDALTSEFDKAGPNLDGSWSYFADADGSKRLTTSEVAALGDGEGAFWASRDWHLAHCMFYWEKLVRMRDTGVVMEERFDRVEHARHCRRLAMKQNPDHSLLIEVGVVLSSGIVATN